MARYAVLLRGINVGGRSKLAMADLRRVLESLNYADVTTYLQSGNAVVSATRTSPAKIEREVAAALAADAGREIPVLVRTHAELVAVVDGNPFPEAVEEPKLFHVAFLAEQPPAEALAGIDRDAYLPERFEFGADRALYLHYVGGMGRSKMANANPGKFKIVATARNWNTVLKLVDLTS